MIRRAGPLLLVMAVLLVFFRWQEERFLAADNMLNLLDRVSVPAIMAFGMTLTILIGGIDLSVGAVVALVGTVTVYVLRKGGEDGPSLPWLVLALASGLGAAALFGLFNGVCAACTRIPPFIITLATMWIARGAALQFNEGQPLPVPDECTAFLALGNKRILGVVPVPIVIMLLVFAAAGCLLHRTRFGQHLYAIGGNREAARFTGIRIARHEISVYVLCALSAGVAGMIHAAQLYSAEPASGVAFELDAIAAAVVGGTSFAGGIGTMYGTLLGAIIMGILEKGLNQTGVHHSLQYVVKGVVVLGTVLLDVRRRR